MWLPIKDAPRTGKRILVLDWLYTDAGPNVAIAQWHSWGGGEGTWIASNTNDELLNITHWMPAPKMPSRPRHFKEVHGGEGFAGTA